MMAPSMFQCITAVSFLKATQFIQTALKGISQMHHFRFTADNPGVVFMKNVTNDLMGPTHTTLPEQIVLPGLTLEQQY